MTPPTQAKLTPAFFSPDLSDVFEVTWSGLPGDVRPLVTQSQVRAILRRAREHPEESPQAITSWARLEFGDRTPTAAIMTRIVALGRRAPGLLEAQRRRWASHRASARRESAA